MNEQIIAALHRERAGLVRRGLPDRVAQVDAELARLGVAVSAPADERATDETPLETPERRRPTRRRKAAP